MAQTFVIVLEKDLPEARAAYEKAGMGKALFREAARLDLGARTQKVTGIESLLSENPAKLAEQMREEGFDPSKMRLPPEKWFAASEGLKTVRALVAYVTADLNKFKQPNPILRDLRSAEALLVAAEGAGARFHFAKADV